MFFFCLFFKHNITLNTLVYWEKDITWNLHILTIVLYGKPLSILLHYPLLDNGKIIVDTCATSISNYIPQIPACCTLFLNHSLHNPCPWVGVAKSRLTHWGRVTNICIINLTIIGSDNSLSPGRPQAITWTKAGILSTAPLGTNFSEILIKIHIKSYQCDICISNVLIIQINGMENWLSNPHSWAIGVIGWFHCL